MTLLQVADLRFPLVVKPVNGSSSEGVCRADDLDHLMAAVDLVRDINARKLGGYADANRGERAGVLAEDAL